MSKTNEEAAAELAASDEDKTEEEIWEEIDGVDGEPAAGENEPAAIAADKEDELWANSTPEQRSAFDALRSENEKLAQKERSSRGRIGHMQRQLNAATKPAAPMAAAARPESWDGLRKEYPEIAGPVDERLAALEADREQKKKDDAAQLAEDLEENLREQTKLLNEQHDDWLTIAETDNNFGPWLADQPRHIQEAAIRNATQIVDAREAGDVITRYKASRSSQRNDSAGSGNPPGTLTSLERKRKRQLESSSSARPRGAGKATGIPADGDEEAIWQAIDDQEAAARR